jgi:hypothetical protein
MILTINSDYFLNSVNQLIFVMVKCGVFFAVRTEFLNVILMNFVFQRVKALCLTLMALRSKL